MEKKASVRAFPMPIHANRGAGWCRWCGLATDTARRTWHDACVREYKLHTWPAVQIEFLKERDGPKCWDCDEAPEKWVRDPYVSTIWVADWPAGVPRPSYIGIRRALALELEHETPLWKTTHLPDDERRRFFGPENLRLRCAPCHAAKTKREAADRASVKRIEARRGGTRRPRQKIAQRANPWPKGRKIPTKKDRKP